MLARMWSIYAADRRSVPPPRRFAVREWLLGAHGQCDPGVLLFARTLTEARERLPAGVAWRLEREPGEPAELVESWI